MGMHAPGFSLIFQDDSIGFVIINDEYMFTLEMYRRFRNWLRGVVR